MIEARDFVEAARALGFRWYAGVPCSFLTPFINYVGQDETLEYVSATNEGDAVALIAGIALGGDAQGRPARGVTMMQNSGLGNAVSPLTSLTWTFQLPQLLIITWRGQPGITDEPQHALMGPITPQLLDTMQIPWELFPTDLAHIGPALARATRYMDEHRRPYALLMQKGSVAPFALRARERVPRATRVPVHRDVGATAGTALGSREQALREVLRATPAAGTAVFATTGFCGRELYALDDRPNQLYMVGSMGCVSAFALGFARARPDLRVVVLDGDGAALMRLGAMASVGVYARDNLTHVLLDNGVHDSTGGQATVSTDVSFGDIAAACGYAEAFETDEVSRLGLWLAAPAVSGPRFCRLRIRPGSPADLPRPRITPPEVAARFMRHFYKGET